MKLLNKPKPTTTIHATIDENGETLHVSATTQEATQYLQRCAKEKKLRPVTVYADATGTKTLCNERATLRELGLQPDEIAQHETLQSLLDTLNTRGNDEQ